MTGTTALRVVFVPAIWMVRDGQDGNMDKGQDQGRGQGKGKCEQINEENGLRQMRCRKRTTMTMMYVTRLDISLFSYLYPTLPYIITST